MAWVYLGIGTNLGDKLANGQTCVRLLGEQCGAVEQVSQPFASQPWGFESANAFLNWAVRLQTTLSPLQLLDATQAIERQMGRTTKSQNGLYHDRIIDIDILFYETQRWDTPTLSLPHPYLWERDFVRIPLQEILLPEHRQMLLASLS